MKAAAVFARVLLCLALVAGGAVAPAVALTAEELAEIKQKAEQGDAEAQYRLGLMYEEGKGVEKDEVEAFKWFRRANWTHDGAAKKLFEIFYSAAERGEAYPQYEISNAYYGYGVERDQSERLKWLRLAAEQGYAKAQYRLGFIYNDGDGGVEEDAVKAAKWYRLAAKQGHADSQFRLGTSYWNGDGVEKDIKEAVKWWRRAEKQGQSWARTAIGLRYTYGDGGIKQNQREAYIRLPHSETIKSMLTAAQIKSADEEIQKIEERDEKRREEKKKTEEEAALAWRRANVVPDLRRKGDAYYKGKGVLPNYKEAAKWYLQAAERGDAEAQYRLGLMYAEGKRGIEQNHVEAYIWLALAGVNDTGEIGDKAASLRESVEKSLTAEQFEQAQAEATERLEKIKAKQ